jgi:hypothetical protein
MDTLKCAAPRGANDLHRQSGQTRSGTSSKCGFGIANHLLSEVNLTANQNPLDQAECPML